MPTDNRPILSFMTPLPLSIERSQSLAAAHALMRQHRLRHLPVVAGSTLVGLLSMDDMHLLETLPGVDAREAKVEEAMTPKPLVVQTDAPLECVAAEMAQRKLDAAVVVDGGRLVGVFTSTDAFRALAQICHQADCAQTVFHLSIETTSTQVFVTA
jgi:acetoin utilization protein AcuB